MTLTPITTRIYLGEFLGTEILLNPGFETAGAGGDDVFATWDENTATRVFDETTTVHGGTHAAWIVSQTTGILLAGIIHQHFVTTPLHLYRLSFWIYGDGTNEATYGVFDVSNGNSIKAGSVGVSDEAWSKVTVYFVAPAACLEAFVRFTAPFVEGGLALVDDVSIVDMADYSWTELADVLPSPPPMWGGGIGSPSPMDLVAGPGILRFSLDNSHSNSTATPGLYSPGSASVLAGFAKEVPIKVTIDDGVSEDTVWFGWIKRIVPSAGLFGDPVTEVEARDWMEYAAGQELGLVLAQSSKRADEAIDILLTRVLHQPLAWDLDVGVETFDAVFDTDQAQSSILFVLAKMARNELGRIHQTPAGVLTFENRDARPLKTTSDFTLSDAADQPASALVAAYEPIGANVVQAAIVPGLTDAAATTVLWSLSGCPLINPQETLDLECPFTDPDTGRKINAVDVEDPVTTFEFGTLPNFVSDNLHAFLSQELEIGSGGMKAHLTNTSRTQPGYLNDFQPKGKAIHRYSQLIIESRDDASVEAVGVRRFSMLLDEIADAAKAKNYAIYVREILGLDGVVARQVSFVANQSAALAAAARGLHVSSRFTLIESATGISEDFFVNHYTYSQAGSLLIVDMIGVPIGVEGGVALWDVDDWDDAAKHWGL